MAKAKAGEGFTYDLQETFLAEGRLRTETILNRALRGMPYVPIDMARQMNLIPEATIDIDLGLYTHNEFFTGRHLYVGASRVTSGEYLHMATRTNVGVIRDKLKDVLLDQEEEPDHDHTEEEQLTSIFDEDIELTWD